MALFPTLETRYATTKVVTCTYSALWFAASNGCPFGLFSYKQDGGGLYNRFRFRLDYTTTRTGFRTHSTVCLTTSSCHDHGFLDLFPLGLTKGFHSCWLLHNWVKHWNNLRRQLERYGRGVKGMLLINLNDRRRL